MIVATNGIHLHVDERGAGRTALVFLHYWGGTARTWDHVVDLLHSDFRTVTIDQRGWGRSDRPAGGYALEDLAGDAEGVIEALELERYVLVGHSMGGKVAQRFASQRPRGLVGLALVAPSPPSPLGIPLEIREQMVHAYDSRDSIVATVQQVLAPGGLTPRDLEAVVRDSLSGCSAAKRAWPLSTSQQDITAEVAHIVVPTIVISGECDRVDPPETLRRELLPHIPHAEMRVLPEVGHLSPLEAAADVAAIIRRFALGLDG